MKVLCICGSPRSKGNSHTVLQSVIDGISENIPSAEVTSISAYKQKVSACVHCDSCRNGKSEHCIQKDDTRAVIAMVEEADVLVLSTPVYWWGISAQLKLIVDKFYSREPVLKEQRKKLMVLGVGAGALDDKQHDIIRSQFECICGYLNWELAASVAFSAYEAGEIAENADAIEQARALWKNL